MIAAHQTMLAPPALIPPEFTEVEYIQNTGSSTTTAADYSWIDTGIVPAADTIVESRHILVSKINDYPGFYGTASYSTPYQRMSLGASWGQTAANIYKPYIRRGNASSDAVSTAKISNNWARYVFDGATCTAYDDGGNTLAAMTSSTPTACLYPMQIFRDGIVQNGSIRLGSGFGISRCSFFRMSRNGEYQINLVPVRRGTEAGFYDLVSKTFFGSANQNAQLVAGPDK